LHVVRDNALARLLVPALEVSDAGLNIETFYVENFDVGTASSMPSRKGFIRNAVSLFSMRTLPLTANTLGKVNFPVKLL